LRHKNKSKRCILEENKTSPTIKSRQPSKFTSGSTLSFSGAYFSRDRPYFSPVEESVFPLATPHPEEWLVCALNENERPSKPEEREVAFGVEKIQSSDEGFNLK
jgi:hypothetical protein